MEHGNSTSTTEDDAKLAAMDMQYVLYLLGIIGIVVLMWFFFSVLGKLVEKIIIWIYPAYCSILALKMESPEEEDGNKWLTYWITLAIVDVMEDLLASCLPCYRLAKCLFMVWCMAPLENNGSSSIYNNYLTKNFSGLFNNNGNFTGVLHGGLVIVINWIIESK